MFDIYFGIALMLLLSLGSLMLGLRVGEVTSRGVAALLGLPVLGLVVLQSLLFVDNLRLAAVLPFSNLVIVGNWSLLGVGFLAGLAWRHVPRPVWRKLLATVPLISICLYHSYGWLPGRAPRCGNVWLDGVCVQTAPATCSAACAATVLKAHGIPATESELAQLCLTRLWGTSALGIYRGLKRKTADTPYDVAPFHWTLDQMRTKPPGPVLLDVRLTREATTDPRYERDWGWTVGQVHTVVLFRFLPNDLVEMGDPSIGREKWHVDSLKVLWQGSGMRLVRRR